MLDTSVISEPPHIVIMTRFARLVTTAPLELSCQSDAQRLSTTLALVLLTFPSANLVRLDTTALITTQYRVFAPRATSAQRRPKNQFPAGKEPTIPTRSKNLRVIALSVPLELLATNAVSTTTLSSCAHLAITAPRAA